MKAKVTKENEKGHSFKIGSYWFYSKPTTYMLYGQHLLISTKIIELNKWKKNQQHGIQLILKTNK